MRNFTKLQSWLMLMVMGLMLSASSAFADSNDISGSVTATSTYLSGATSDLSFNLTYTSPDAEWGDDLTLTFPAGFTINSASDLNGKVAVITGQNVFWDVQYVSSNVNEDFSVNVTVDASVLGNQNIDYVFNGDQWGNPPHSFSGVAVIGQAVPKLAINPTAIDLGEWPIGGWQADAYLELVNDGTGDVEVTGSELDDPDGVFGLTNISLPTTLVEGGASAYVGVNFTGAGVADGVYNATYVASWGSAKSVTTAAVTATAYTAAVGDIAENPFMVALPVSEAGVSTALPMRSNYVIPGTATNGKDVVYKFTLAEDKELSVAITNASETPKMAIYASDFGGVGGPSVSNALVSGGADITNTPLFAGDYYLVVSAEAADAAMTFDIDITATTMPDPEKAFNPTPADAAVDVPSNGIVLSWEFGQFTNEYKLSFGTTYPPSDVLVDWTSDLATTYALSNLDPSMQYFWRVDVRNNNGTVTGDVWGFTTTITPPSNLTATVDEITPDEYNVVLNWTASAKALLSYNVYRDGAMIGTTAAGTTTYTDLDLAYNMNPCYEYYVEAIFDEGVSAPSNTASACITGTGILDGTVTELLTGNPIEGALVTITDGTNTYTANTDFMGMYSVSVYEGTYDIRVSADGYITEDALAVALPYNTTVTNDFQLDEFPYPVDAVIATEVNDNTVQVDWSGNGGGNIAQWLFYDDGTNVDAIGGPATFTWAIKFDADQLVDFPGSSVTKFQFYVHAGVNETVHFMVMQGDNAETTLYTEDFSGLTQDAWNEVTLSAPVAFDNTQALWFGIHTEQGGSYPASCGADMGEPNGDLITLDGTTWEHLSGYGLMYTWNLRGFITDASGKSYSMTKASAPAYKAVNADLAVAHVAPGANATIPQTADVNAKDIMGYNVYRQVCDESSPMQFLGMTLDNQFTDNTWGAVEWGTYKWAVEVIYTNNVSEVAYSNCLDKDMEAVVNVEVTTNSGDAPEGCNVIFTNTSEPDLGLVYDITLDATGLATIEPFRKGTYDITVTLAGYADLAFADVLVDSDQTFVWQLEELLAPPTDLYVTPTGFATWGGGGALPFEALMENFDTQDQFDMWEVVDGGSSSDTWFYATDYNGSTLDGTPFAFVNSDAAGSGTTMDEMLISPVIDASMVSELHLDWDQNYQNFAGEDHIAVEVFDGADWVEVFYQDTDDQAFPTLVHNSIDVTAYANAEFRVRFHYVAPGWDWYFAVDNVAVTDENGKYADASKAFQFYKVWHDGVFSTDVDTNFYQYGESGEVLVPGTTYLAEVAALYSTGLSDKAQYEWTYLPCDSFPGYNVMEAANVDGSDDVLVVWSDMIPMELIQINQGYGDPLNGYYQAFGYGYGVAYDFTAYPDALVSSVDFRHSSWGTTGIWDFKIHIIDWANQTEIAAVGPFQTTGDDQWENGIELGDIATNGATSVAILMEPMGNDAADAYPCLDSDNDGDPQGSIYGDLSDYSSIGSSTIGNFLMNVWIYTANGGGKSTPVVMNVNEAPAAQARIANSFSFNPQQIVTQQEVSDKSGKAAVTTLGTNVYRDGEMIAFVAEPDTFFMDMNLMPGYYDYCIAKVYTEDDGAHSWTSCLDANCVEDVLVPEDCLAPENLTAEDLLGDGYTATLNWDAPNGFDPVWLQYDDGVNVDAIGGPAEFSVAAKWDPSQLADYDGTAITKVKFFPREPGSSFTLKIWKGSNAGTLLLEQPLSGLTFDDWNEITLDTPVDIDVTEELWVGYYVVTSGYPAGCGNFTGNSNSDYVTLDGVTWGHLADYGLSYSWNLAAYVEAAKGAYVALPGLVDHATYSDNKATFAAGNLPVSPNAVDPTAGVTELMGYNVYRDGTQVNDDLVTETTYADVTGVAGYFCYKVTAVYSVCGESDFSNEACVDVAAGVSDIENNVSVYPNPATTFVMVEANSQIRSIEITNYMGQVVSAVKDVETTQTRIETSSLSAGVYFVEVETEAGIEKVRIVISE